MDDEPQDKGILRSEYSQPDYTGQAEALRQWTAGVHERAERRLDIESKDRREPLNRLHKVPLLLRSSYERATGHETIDTDDE